MHYKGRRHKKKRNTLLLYEFLLRHMVEGIVTDDNGRIEKVLSIIKRRFKPGTELYKEWRLMRTLSRTAGVDETTANAIIRETRDAVRRYDKKKLDIEKSNLIKEINHTFGKDFYDIAVDNYRTFAMIQMLFEGWRTTGVPNISMIADYEKKLHDLLIEERNIEFTQPDPEVDALVVKLMVEKLNRNYARSLSRLQRSILGHYVFECSDDSLRRRLTSVRQSTLKLLDEHVKTVSQDDKFTRTKLAKARAIIESLPTSNFDDAVVAKYMKLCELHDELERKG